MWGLCHGARGAASPPGEAAEPQQVRGLLGDTLRRRHEDSPMKTTAVVVALIALLFGVPGITGCDSAETGASSCTQAEAHLEACFGAGGAARWATAPSRRPSSS